MGSGGSSFKSMPEPSEWPGCPKLPWVSKASLHQVSSEVSRLSCVNVMPQPVNTRSGKKQLLSAEAETWEAQSQEEPGHTYLAICFESGELLRLFTGAWVP